MIKSSPSSGCICNKIPVNNPLGFYRGGAKSVEGFARRTRVTLPSISTGVANATHKNTDAPHIGQGELGSSKSVVEAEKKYLLGNYARTPVVFVRGEGCSLYDMEGKEYLDMTAGIAVNSLGYGDAHWVRAVSEQAATLTHVSNIFYSIPQVKLGKRLVESSFADKVFFSNSGTEANEAAIKFARKYQISTSSGAPNHATEFIAFTNSFHGRTMGALALTSKEKYRTPFEPVMPGVQFVEFGNVEAVKKAFKPGRTAAVFVEPIQGEGGIYGSTHEFLILLRSLCDESNALLVFDEVQCGLGRTGYLWAHEAYSVYPDIMTLAKPLAGGLPIGAVLMTEKVASTINPGDHGSTFAGGPLVCHAANAVLDKIQSPGFLESVAQKGELLKRLLTKKLASNAHVADIRGSGLLVGVELDVSATPLVEAALSSGLLILTAGAGNIVRLAPPLIISEQELEKAVDILSKCIDILDKSA